ncbi:hypothetical protein PFUM301597_18240 [Pseudomonas fluorescens]
MVPMNCAFWAFVDKLFVTDIIASPFMMIIRKPEARLLLSTPIKPQKEELGNCQKSQFTKVYLTASCGPDEKGICAQSHTLV